MSSSQSERIKIELQQIRRSNSADQATRGRSLESRLNAAFGRRAVSLERSPTTKASEEFNKNAANRREKEDISPGITTHCNHNLPPRSSSNKELLKVSKPGLGRSSSLGPSRGRSPEKQLMSDTSTGDIRAFLLDRSTRKTSGSHEFQNSDEEKAKDSSSTVDDTCSTEQQLDAADATGTLSEGFDIDSSSDEKKIDCNNSSAESERNSTHDVSLKACEASDHNDCREETESQHLESSQRTDSLLELTTYVQLQDTTNEESLKSQAYWSDDIIQQRLMIDESSISEVYLDSENSMENSQEYASQSFVDQVLNNGEPSSSGETGFFSSLCKEDETNCAIGEERSSLSHRDESTESSRRDQVTPPSLPAPSSVIEDSVPFQRTSDDLETLSTVENLAPLRSSSSDLSMGRSIEKGQSGTSTGTGDDRAFSFERSTLTTSGSYDSHCSKEEHTADRASTVDLTSRTELELNATQTDATGMPSDDINVETSDDEGRIGIKDSTVESKRNSTQEVPLNGSDANDAHVCMEDLPSQQLESIETKGSLLKLTTDERRQHTTNESSFDAQEYWSDDLVQQRLTMDESSISKIYLDTENNTDNQECANRSFVDRVLKECESPPVQETSHSSSAINEDNAAFSESDEGAESSRNQITYPSLPATPSFGDDLEALKDYRGSPQSLPHYSSFTDDVVMLRQYRNDSMAKGAISGTGSRSLNQEDEMASCESTLDLLTKTGLLGGKRVPRVPHIHSSRSTMSDPSPVGSVARSWSFPSSAEEKTTPGETGTPMDATGLSRSFCLDNERESRAMMRRIQSLDSVSSALASEKSTIHKLQSKGSCSHSLGESMRPSSSSSSDCFIQRDRTSSLDRTNHGHGLEDLDETVATFLSSLEQTKKKTNENDETETDRDAARSRASSLDRIRHGTSSDTEDSEYGSDLIKPHSDSEDSLDKTHHGASPGLGHLDLPYTDEPNVSSSTGESCCAEDELISLFSIDALVNKENNDRQMRHKRCQSLPATFPALTHHEEEDVDNFRDIKNRIKKLRISNDDGGRSLEGAEGISPNTLLGGQLLLAKYLEENGYNKVDAAITAAQFEQRQQKLEKRRQQDIEASSATVMKYKSPPAPAASNLVEGMENVWISGAPASPSTPVNVSLVSESRYFENVSVEQEVSPPIVIDHNQADTTLSSAGIRSSVRTLYGREGYATATGIPRQWVGDPASAEPLSKNDNKDPPTSYNVDRIEEYQPRTTGETLKLLFCCFSSRDEENRE